MHALIPLIIFIALAAVVGAARKTQKGRKRSRIYRSTRRSRKGEARGQPGTEARASPPIDEKRYFSKPLLTQNEREFFLRLKEALPNHHIMAQVAMGALMDVENWGSQSHWKYWQRRAEFDKKIVDFVVLDAGFEVVTLVELDDRSHDSKKEKDRERDKMVAAAGYPTVRYQSSPSQRPDVRTIAANVAYIEQTMAARRVP